MTSKELNLADAIDSWEQHWCSDSEGMHPDMRAELDGIIIESIKRLKAELETTDYFIGEPEMFESKVWKYVKKIFGEKLT
jgi:hypothetical protein